MAEPNLDLGLDYTGGIAAPTVADVGRYARVALDNVGDPNLEYVDGVERRIYFSSANVAFTGTTVQSVLASLMTIDANKLIDGSKSRLRVRVLAEFPTTIGTRIGLQLNSGPVALDSVQHTLVAPSSTTPTVYECVIYPGGAAVQRTNGMLDISSLPRIVSTSGTTANMAINQTLELVCKLNNAADTLTVRRVEVYAIGL